MRRAGQLTGNVPVESGRPDDQFSESSRQIDVEDVASADPYGGVSAGEVLASRSPTKSVEANVRRGRAAMTRVLLDKADVHRAMFRTGLGWVDFVWGDDGPYTGHRMLRGKGVAHLLDERQRKDGLTPDEARRVAERMVEVIARGTEARRSEVERSVRAVLDDGEYEAVLTKAPGGNAWLLSGWRKLVGIGGGPAANDAKAPTRSTADSSDRRAGAIPAKNTVPPATPGGQILASGPPLPQGSDDVEFQAGAAYVPMYQVAGSPPAPQTITIGRMAGDERTLEVPKQPVRREQIMDAFQRAFQVRVYQGKPFKFRSALGFFRPRKLRGADQGAQRPRGHGSRGLALARPHLSGAAAALSPAAVSRPAAGRQLRRKEPERGLRRVRPAVHAERARGGEPRARALPGLRADGTAARIGGADRKFKVPMRRPYWLSPAASPART